MMQPALDAFPLQPAGRSATRPSRRQSDLQLLRTFAAVSATLDHLQQGVALVDARMHVHYANRQLHGLVARADGLLMRDGVLAAPTVPEAQALSRAVTQTLTDGADITVRVRRLAPRRPLSVLLRPLGLLAEVNGSGESALPLTLLLISDPERGAIPPAVRLMQAYGLTAAEAALTQQLLKGLDIRAVARQSRVSILTTRTHLRQVLAKTGTHRQSELMRVLLQEFGWMSST